jgi:hypothetical protein
MVSLGSDFVANKSIFLHLVSGFVRSEVPTWATTLRGSDLLSVGRSFYK